MHIEHCFPKPFPSAPSRKVNMETSFPVNKSSYRRPKYWKTVERDNFSLCWHGLCPEFGRIYQTSRIPPLIPKRDSLLAWNLTKTREIKAEQSMAGNSNVSSPDNNNYGGPQQAYKYQSLVETPSSPELANHRGGGRKSKTPGTPATPPGTPEIIQVGFDKN